MPLLDPDQLAGMREAAEGALTQEATIRRATQTKVSGRPHTAFTPDTAPVPCRFVTGSQREAEVGEQVQGVSDGKIKLPWGTAITTHDQIDVEGQTFSIVGHNRERADATLLVLRVLRVGEAATSPIAQ